MTSIVAFVSWNLMVICHMFNASSASVRDLYSTGLFALSVFVLTGVCRAEDGIRRIPFGDHPHYSQSVSVTGRELVHTAQLFPVDQYGEVLYVGDAHRQVQRVLDSVVDVLAAQQATPDGLIKLNVYLADESAFGPLLGALPQRFGAALPALSFVTTRLPVDGALLAVDAVAARTPTISDSQVVLRREKTVAGLDGSMAHSAVLPVGETIYISGQAEPGDDLREATAATLEGLKKTLDHLGLRLEHVVQLKCFLQPMAYVDQACEEIDTFFEGQLAPPTSFVEWISASPIEIEMIVHAPIATTGASLTHEWLPWLTNSPVYCRLAWVRSPTQIFISHCDGGSGPETEQVAGTFGQLQRRLTEAGSDLRHMAKATYYVRNEAASAAMNAIRPKLYDPEHPPAASKALVYGVGPAGHAVALDMIAVPANE